MSSLEKKFVIKEVFKDVSRMKDERYEYGGENSHYNIYWAASLIKKNNNFEFGVSCEPADAEDDFSVKVDLEIRVTSGEKVILAVQKEHTFVDKYEDEDVLHISKQAEIEKRMITDDLTVEYHMKILEIHGVEGMKSRYDESMKKFSDIVLVVEGEKFYVSKGYLASRSPYFENLFMGNSKESAQSEIVLNGIGVEDFQNFLDILYVENTVNDENVDSVLCVANMYDTKCVLKQAEKFLLGISQGKSEKSTKEKGELALKYNLREVKDFFLTGMEALFQFGALPPSDLPLLMTLREK